jgi:hypothetical protein
MTMKKEQLYHFMGFLQVFKDNLCDLDGINENDFENSDWIGPEMIAMTRNSKEKYERANSDLVEDILSVCETKLDDESTAELLNQQHEKKEGRAVN